MRNVSDKIIEKIKTHISCSITFFFNRAVCEIMLNNIVNSSMPQKTIWHVHIVCWIPKAYKYTHSNTYCSSTAWMVAWMCLSVMLYIHYLSCWSYRIQLLLEWEMFQTKVVEKIKTHILCYITFFFFFENGGVYEIMLKNSVQLGRS